MTNPTANKPTSLAAMKKHTHYCIKVQLGKYEMLAPTAKPCRDFPVFKGHKVYQRKDVSPLHTADKWKRKLRKVRSEEFDRPVRAPNLEKARAHAKEAKAAAAAKGQKGSGNSAGGGGGGMRHFIYVTGNDAELD